MFKSGLKLLFGTFTQIIIVIISYEYIFRYALSHGGVGVVNSIDSVNKLIWWIVFVELLISVFLMGLGFKNEIKPLMKQ